MVNEEQGKLAQPMRLIEVDLTHVNGDDIKFLVLAPTETLPLDDREKEQFNEAIYQATRILTLGYGRLLAQEGKV